ncbi:hypothetical protein BKA58DRAFT_385023 [Alternaria rosae]|uniref:uncharacterized protein n=1 Tax=Alternaria rosae TaxID=1187941 RepID=UPI001E8D47C4|nr:uncharacterized protein BKA58DRAFT_385023 [Alternaria rosae]KAH6870403.1 hypothetical protein BKA58DRAFT_385023 [Alternaria rosae]
MSTLRLSSLPFRLQNAWRSLKDRKMGSPQNVPVPEACTPGSLVADSLSNSRSDDYQISIISTLSRRDENPARCTFLDLPAEIRNHIYGYIVGKFERKITDHCGKERCVTTVKGVFSQLPRSIRGLLNTCKTIWLELLSLLFGSYTWTADLLLRTSPPGKILTRSHKSWLREPSTLFHPTSNNIRRVNFRIRDTVPRPGSSPKLLLIYTIKIRLDDRTNAGAFTARASGIATGILGESRYDFQLDKSKALEQVLEQGINSALQEVVKAKLESRQSCSCFTVEEWQGLVLKLKEAYMAWIVDEQAPE